MNYTPMQNLESGEFAILRHPKDEWTPRITFAADLQSVVRLPKRSDETRHRYALLPDLAHARISRPAASRLHQR